MNPYRHIPAPSNYARIKYKLLHAYDFFSTRRSIELIKTNSSLLSAIGDAL